MIVRVVAFTASGRALARRIADLLADDFVEIRSNEPLDEWTREAFATRAALVFVGATGIAVRTIAPFLKSKGVDSPVLVVDEGSRFVIPLLSGHLGGANRLANELSARLGATPAITTATDIRGLFAVDVFARLNRLRVCDASGIVKVSSKVLAGERVAIAIAPDVKFTDANVPPEVELRPYPPTTPVDVVVSESHADEEFAALRLAPQRFVLGIGCRRGIAPQVLERFVDERLRRVGVEWEEVAAIASIDVKRDEYALARLATKQGVEFATYCASELAALSGEFASSAFVASQVGVGNVCERAAARYAGDGYEFVLRKSSADGATLAVVKRTPRVRRWKEG